MTLSLLCRAWILQEAVSLTSAGSVRVPYGMALSKKEQGALCTWALLLWGVASGAAVYLYGIGGAVVSALQLLRLLFSLRFKICFAKPAFSALGKLLRETPRRWIVLAVLTATRDPVVFLTGIALCCAALRFDAKVWIALLTMAAVTVLSGFGYTLCAAVGIAMAVCCFPALPLAALLLLAAAGLCALLPTPFGWTSAAVCFAACLLMRKTLYSAILPLRARLLKKRLGR